MIPQRFDDRYDPEPDYELEDMRRYAQEEDELDRERERWRREHPIPVLKP